MWEIGVEIFGAQGPDLPERLESGESKYGIHPGASSIHGRFWLIIQLGVMQGWFSRGVEAGEVLNRKEIFLGRLLCPFHFVEPRQHIL